MHLLGVKIKNFKGIKQWEINFKPGFNLIKGDNGKGKTSILEAISVGLGGFVAGLEGVATRHFSKEEIRQVYTHVGYASYNKKYEVPVEVTMNVNLYGKEIAWTRKRNSVNASRSTVQPRDICKKAEEIANNDLRELPILAYLGAGRVWSQKREKSVNVFRKKYFRTVGYTDSLLEASNIKLLLNWCAKMEQLEWKKEMKIPEYEAVKKAVAYFMHCINLDGNYEIFYDKQDEELMFKADEKVLPVMQLSAGYQSLIWMVFDIAYRMAILNPVKGEKIAETSGVVLIDELDMHLHPKWQWNVINALKKVFPNVQFIATTHAPILLISDRNTLLIDIENDKIDYGYTLYGLDINDSVKNYQGTNSVPKKINEQIIKFEDALDREDYQEAKSILDILQKDADDKRYPLLIRMINRYELETMKWDETE